MERHWLVLFILVAIRLALAQTDVSIESSSVAETSSDVKNTEKAEVPSTSEPVSSGSIATEKPPLNLFKSPSSIKTAQRVKIPEASSEYALPWNVADTTQEVITSFPTTQEPTTVSVSWFQHDQQHVQQQQQVQVPQTQEQQRVQLQQQYQQPVQQYQPQQPVQQYQPQQQEQQRVQLNQQREQQQVQVQEQQEQKQVQIQQQVPVQQQQQVPVQQQQQVPVQQQQQVPVQQQQQVQVQHEQVHQDKIPQYQPQQKEQIPVQVQQDKIPQYQQQQKEQQQIQVQEQQRVQLHQQQEQQRVQLQQQQEQQRIQLQQQQEQQKVQLQSPVKPPRQQIQQQYQQRIQYQQQRIQQQHHQQQIQQQQQTHQQQRQAFEQEISNNKQFKSSSIKTAPSQQSLKNPESNNEVDPKGKVPFHSQLSEAERLQKADQALDQFFNDVLANLSVKMKTGMDEPLGEILDPVRLDDMQLQPLVAGEVFDVKMKKITVSGLSDYRITQLESQLNDSRIKIGIHYPKLSANCIFGANGTMYEIFKVTGKGNATIIFNEVHARTVIYLSKDNGVLQVSTADQPYVDFSSAEILFKDEDAAEDSEPVKAESVATQLGPLYFWVLTANAVDKIDYPLALYFNKALKEFPLSDFLDGHIFRQRHLRIHVPSNPIPYAYVASENAK